jgi:hypothetical protein
MPILVVDIGNEDDELGRALSNFEAYPFIFRTVACGSMEGLLQSLKFEDAQKQRDICALVGTKAKFKGKKRKWWLEQKLHWQGESFSRHSQTYQSLLTEAFDALSANEHFMETLLKTSNINLVHTMGKSDPNRTILTENEFCAQLHRIRQIKRP